MYDTFRETWIRGFNINITLPNHMYYIDILYKNIFLAINNKEKNIGSIYKQIISITKYIMTFSNTNS